MIQLIAGAAGGGLVVGSLLAAWAMGTYKDATWSAATNQLKVEAAEVLQKATEDVAAIDQAAQMKVRALEVQYVQEEKSLAAIERRNRALATELGGLRDPGRRASSENTMPGAPASASNVACATDPTLLSAEATAVLLDAAAEVDALANYARTGYEYAKSIDEMRVEGAGSP